MRKDELAKVSAWAEGLNSRLLKVENWAGSLERHITDLESQKAVQLLKRAKLIR